MFYAGIPNSLGEGEKSDWYGQYGVRQVNHNSAEDKAVIRPGKMKNLQFDPAE
jgi:hypothetical protein